MVQRVRKLAVKLLMILCVVCCVIGVALAFTACSGDTRSVSSFTINADGELVVNYSDNTSENLGKVTADAPERSVVSAEIVDGELIIHYSDGTQENLGSVSGGSGAQGNGIKSITLRDDGKALVITLEDGTGTAIPSLTRQAILPISTVHISRSIRTAVTPRSSTTCFTTKRCSKRPRFPQPAPRMHTPR